VKVMIVALIKMGNIIKVGNASSLELSLEVPSKCVYIYLNLFFKQSKF
jgi:hypothetical protein